jgi:spore maturation protein CgeB
MKIDLLVAGNQYGTAIHFAKGLGSALQRYGVTTRLFWVDDGYFFQAFHAILEDPPDLTCSFADISFSRQPLGDLWQIPHLCWMVDPPIYFLHQLTGQYTSVACVDEEDAAFIKCLGFSKVCFLPHGAEASHLAPLGGHRPYRIVFFGSCVDYEQIASEWPPEMRAVLLAASARVLSPEGITLVQALQEAGVTSSNLAHYHGELDRYTRGKERCELIRSIQEPVHIWGAGPWKKYFPNHPIHSPVSFDTTLKIMKRSQVVLNSTPRFKAGAHERIFYALLCGAAVYTAENRYLTSHLPELLTYRFGEWAPPSFREWQTCAAAGQTRVLTSHTWDARIPTLVAHLKNQ